MVPAPGLSLIHAHPADQWKPIVNPEINPGSDVFPTFKKVAKTRVLGGKKPASSTNGALKPGYPSVEE